MAKSINFNEKDIAAQMMSENKKDGYSKQVPYVGAPYNFVSFTNDVYEYPKEKQIFHDEVSDKLMTGEIVYQITAQTPIMIDDGTGSFYRTNHKNGDYAIPGSTIRGCIRNNLQILGLSSMNEDIDDYALMYRSVASGPKTEKKHYADILGVDNSNSETRGIAKDVKAGYLFLKNGRYYINKVEESFDKKVNYLMLNSKYILTNKEHFPFFIEDWKHHMMYTNNCVFERKETIKGIYNNQPVKFIYKTEDKEELKKCVQNSRFSFEQSNSSEDRKIKIMELSKIGQVDTYTHKGKICYRDGEIDEMISYEPKRKSMINTYYEPYYKPVYYCLDRSQKKVVAVYSRNCEKKSLPSDIKKGYVLSSGWIGSKKNLYIIPEVECNVDTAFDVTDRVPAFSADLQRRLSTLRQYFKNGAKTKKEQEQCALNFFGLPQNEGEKKPVFYIEKGLHFGFTPRLRIFYDHTIKQGLNDNHKQGVLDYSKAIFGYCNEEESYKSRVSFTDAVISSKTEELPLKEYTLSEPKPFSYLDYLIQEEGTSNHAVTYNNPNRKLRGIKQYWLHRDTTESQVNQKKKKNAQKDSEEKSFSSKFHPLAANTKFVGKVRFWNLSEDELGLLLWSIRLDPEKSWMNIGKAKSYGYGNVSINLLSVKKLDQSKAYALDSLHLYPFEDISNEEVEGLIQIYKEHINQFLNGRKIDELDSIKEFFMMKNSKIIPEEKSIRYMNIDNKEYQNRKLPLPSIIDTINRKSK